MSEKSKAEKLAAARKLLKEFQQKLPVKTSESNYNIDTKSLIHDEVPPEVEENKSSNTSNFDESTIVMPPPNNVENNPNFNIIKEPNLIKNIEISNFKDLQENETNLNEMPKMVQNPFENIFQQTHAGNNFYENFPVNSQETNQPLMYNVPLFNELNQNSTVPFPHTNNKSQIENKNVDSDSLPNISTGECDSQLMISHFKQNDQNIMELLNQERTKNNDLLIENQKISEQYEILKKQLHELQSESNKIVQQENNIESLQEQLQLHMNTIKVLVGEKTELNSQINKYETLLNNHTSESEELQGRLRAARHKVADSDKELMQCKRFIQQLETESNNLKEENNKLKNEYTSSIKSCDDLKEEVSELKEKVKFLSADCKRLENEVAEKCNELSLSHLKIQQISSGDNIAIDNNLESLVEEKKTLLTRLSSMEENLNKSKNETAQVTQQYKQYCQQLNTQMQNLVTSLQEKSEEIEKLCAREKDLMSHLADLEKQLQTAPRVKSSTVANESLSTELNEYKRKYLAVERRCDELSQEVTQKSSEFRMINEELDKSKEKIIELEEKLENLQSDQLDTAKLNAAIESDKIAAARSMAQNAELKQQIEELQRSFIQMSDYKLEITEKLNCEQHLGRELNLQVTKLENELLKLRTVLQAKDEEMIRLQNENTNLSKEIIQQAQLSDRLRHYEAKDNVTDLVQKELQQARDQIATLLGRNTELENILANSIADVKLSNKYEEGYNVAKRLIRENSSESSDVMETIPENDTPVSMYESKNDISKVGVETVPVIATQEAMEKLQERFTKTMDDIAELTEEKQRLEHLVLQLQSETETVGEYIALYQNQRSLLKQREIEKDNQLLKLAHDQEDMKNKLLRLNQLVVQLLKEKTETTIGKYHENIIQQDEDNNELHSKPEDTSKMESINTTNCNTVPVNAELLDNLPNSNNFKTTDTARKIIDLLSELKDSDLIHPLNGDDSDAFAHHCHCCSGRLLTV